MWEYIVSALLFMAVYAYYVLIYTTKKTILHYQKAFEERGYKVQVYPFSFFGSSVREKMKQNQEKYGDVNYELKRNLYKYDLRIANMLNGVNIYFINPQLVKEFFSPEKNFYFEKVSFLRENFERFIGRGIAFSEGEEWKKKRKIMNTIFNYSFIVDNIPKISRIVDEGLDEMEREFKSQTVEKTYNAEILEVFGNIFSNVMLECFFGSKSSHEKIQEISIGKFMNNLNNDAAKQGFSPISFLLGIKFLGLGLREKDRDINHRIAIQRAFAREMVQRRIKQIEGSEKGGKYTDIVQALYLSEDFSREYNEENLVNQFLTFFNAGTDTTSHFTQMMIYYTSLNPSVEKRLREQVGKFIKSDEDITMENLKKLQYIDWLQNETTRYYGPGTGIIPRKVIEPHYIGGVYIQKGVNLSINSMATHYNPEIYKDPLQFRPERWESECDKNRPFTLVGFSGGPRNCIGKHLALLENKIAMVKMVRRYKSFELPKKNFVMKSGLMSEAEAMKITITSF